jgi:pilus assembly protein CpaE
MVGLRKLGEMSASATKHPWKLLVVCPHPVLSNQIRASVGGLGLETCSVSEYPVPGAIAGIATQHECNICFLDVATDQERALQLIAEAAPAVPVVALNPKNDADLILRCLRRGACEFLSDLSAEQVSGVLERLGLLRVPMDQPKPATVYCVVPGKAGCGASTLATHVAIEMHRVAGSRVLLVDTDCVAASVSFLLKLKPLFHLGDAVQDCLRLDEDLWGRLVTKAHGIDVLAAPESPSARINLDRPAAVELICFWREHYDAVVIDVAAAYGWGCDLASLSDEVLLVTTNELAALYTTKRSIESLEQSGVARSRLKLLVTRYTPSTGLKREDVETALKLAPYGLLNNDYDAIQNAILEGQPAAAGTNCGRSISTLAERLTGKQRPVRKRSPWFGLLPARA